MRLQFLKLGIYSKSLSRIANGISLIMNQSFYMNYSMIVLTPITTGNSLLRSWRLLRWYRENISSQFSEADTSELLESEEMFSR